MDILFEINHPGQVHLLRNIYTCLKERGHSIVVFAKDDTIITYLLNCYSIPFRNLGKKGNGTIGKFIKQFKFDFIIWKHVVRTKTQIGLGSSISNDHVSFISHMKSIHPSDDDFDVVPFITKYSYPFSDLILTPDCLKHSKFQNKTIRYSGYHELAYLHPKRFNPELEVIKKIGLNESDRFFVIRFNAFKAHHDLNVKGLSYDQKKCLIGFLSKRGKVFITTEGEIEPEFKEFKLNIPLDKVHSLLYYATMFLGDSQTMTSEAAVLGTPAIRCNSLVGSISYLEEEEKKYGLTYGFMPEDFRELLNKVNDLLNMDNLKEEWETRRQKMLSDKIDVTAFIVWFVENYPDSKFIMAKNPEYQYNFK